MAMHRRLLEIQKARVQTTRRILDASATDEGLTESIQQKMIVRVKKRLQENHESSWDNRPRTQSQSQTGHRQNYSANETMRSL